MRMVQQNLCVYLDDGEYDDDGDVNDNDGDDGSPSTSSRILGIQEGRGRGVTVYHQPTTN